MWENERYPGRRAFFGESLWTSSLAGRSSLLTPLYIIRAGSSRQRSFETTHGFWELIVFLSGRGEFSANGVRSPFEGGHSVLVPPCVPHMEEPQSFAESIWIGLDGSALERFGLSAPAMIESVAFGRQAEELWLLSERIGLSSANNDVIEERDIDRL